MGWVPQGSLKGDEEQGCHGGGRGQVSMGPHGGAGVVGGGGCDTISSDTISSSRNAHMGSMEGSGR